MDRCPTCSYLALPVLWTVAVAPMVSYRRRDAVAWLVPVVGLLLAVRLAWRLAHLPFRDWPPRADERNRCRPTDVQGDAGQPLYVRTPATGRTPAAD